MFVPTPDQIRQACEKIQQTWSPKERRRRWRNVHPTVGVSSPIMIVKESDLIAAWCDQHAFRYRSGR